ncbi:hypothetical protein [Aeromonas veronii]|uniref:hypothetical protein n=1 Tax=Aeromonas veronii TaxID=654 RepID=UPI0009545C15|nr:hypothetical protein [Aeromonas veronii]SIR55832.1 hypothetical protein SAMN05892873_1533 [Aeromonas veronii]
MILKIKFFLLALLLIGGSASCFAETCNADTCGGLVIPAIAKKLITDGYESVEIKKLLGNEYLFLTTLHDVNRCSVIFKVTNNKIDENPTAGLVEKLCNVSTNNGYVISSWRDKGEWNENIYENNKGKWKLTLSDSCVGCEQVKRIFLDNGKVIRTILVSDGHDFLSREPLVGVIEESKAYLYSGPREKLALKAYLVKGDEFVLSDMSGDGLFYRINYKSSSGEKSYWIRTEDFSLK